jgi:hypothetical protein
MAQRSVRAGALFAAVVVLAIAAHVYFFNAPPCIDEGDFANTGRILLRGGAMYRDAFNEKGPGIYWLTAALFGAFGDRLAVVRGAAAAANLATLALLWLACVRLQRRAAAAPAALLFLAAEFILQGNFWRPETVLAPVLLAAFVFLASGDENVRGRAAQAAAGIAFCAATLIKQTAWLPVVALIAMLAVDVRRQRRAMPWALAAGFVAPWVVVLAVEAARGGLGVFLAGYLFPLHGFVTASYVHAPRREIFFQQLPIWWIALAAWLIFRRSSLGAADKRLWRTLTLGALAMTLPAFFNYHFLPALAFAALGFALPAAEWRAAPQRRAAVVALAGLLALAVASLPFDPLYNVREGLIESNNADPTSHAAGVALVVREMTQPGDPIFVFPHNSIYYYLADRRPPGRYGFLLPWVTPPAAVREVVADMAAHPPRAILFNYFEVCMTNGARPKDYLAPLLEKIAAEYRVQRVFGNRVALLTPLPADAPDAADARRATRNLLFTDLDCRGVSAEQLAQLAR